MILGKSILNPDSALALESVVRSLGTVNAINSTERMILCIELLLLLLTVSKRKQNGFLKGQHWSKSAGQAASV